MAIFVRMLLALSLACICGCKAGEQHQSHWVVAMRMKPRADHVDRNFDDGIDSDEEISTGNNRRSLTESDRTDSVTTMNNLRRTIGSSNMPYMTYDVEGESDAASWTSSCDYDSTFNAQGYVNGYKFITTESKTITTIIRELFNLFPRELSSVYLTSFGCDQRKCSSATYQGRTYRNAQLTLCLLQGGSEYDQDKVQYKLGEGCTECNSGSFWCDYGLCRDDCAASDSCYCNSYCLNCADTDTATCRCQCLPGWTGSRCEANDNINVITSNCSTTARVPIQWIRKRTTTVTSTTRRTTTTVTPTTRRPTTTVTPTTRRTTTTVTPTTRRTTTTVTPTTRRTTTTVTPTTRRTTTPVTPTTRRTTTPVTPTTTKTTTPVTPTTTKTTTTVTPTATRTTTTVTPTTTKITTTGSSTTKKSKAKKVAPIGKPMIQLSMYATMALFLRYYID